MADKKIRLGGMALQNGVLVHGPSAWAVAVRTDEGELKVVSGVKRVRGAQVTNPLIRGPARLADGFLLLPRIKRACPEVRFAFERPVVGFALVLSAAAAKVLRSSPRLGPAAKELLSGGISLLPATLALRGSELAAYHGAEHISIGTYEHGEARGKEHERCGSHLLGPLLLTSAIGNAVATRAPASVRPAARAAAGVGALAASVELFSWMVQNQNNPLARALAMPGHELQHRFVTAEPTPEQLEVANLALDECVRLESAANGDNGAAEEAPPT